MISFDESLLAQANCDENEWFSRLLDRAAARGEETDSILTDGLQTCPHARLRTLIDDIQSLFASQGITAGDCVAATISNSLPSALAVLALLDAGVSLVILPERAKTYQSSDTGAAPTAQPIFCRWIVSEGPRTSTQALASLAPSEFLEVHANPDHDPNVCTPSPESPRLFFQTSGSLGTAKLVAYTYGNFYRNALTAVDLRKFDPSHRIALPTPIFHTYGLSSGLLAGLVAGSSIDLQTRSNVLKYLERETEFEPNVAYVTPALCEMLVRSRRSRRPYEFMITAGDRISHATFKRCEDLHGTTLSQYGMAELGIVAASTPEMPLSARCWTVGRAVRSAELRVVALNSACTDADCGELQVRRAPGYGFEGYVGSDGRLLEFRDKFDGDWYKTGDLARITEDGDLAVLGRCDLSVNRSGVLLPLADVEWRMREIGGVVDVAVCATTADSLRGSELVAFCVIEDGCEATGPELRARFAREAPPFAVPETVQIVKALPRLQNGKTDRATLADWANEK